MASLSPRRRLWLALAAAGLAGLLALGHWGPDAGLRWATQKALHALGWSRVSITHADLSLFNGAIVIKSIEAGKGLGAALGIDGLDIRFRWPPLLSRRIAIDSLDLTGVAVGIRRTGDRVEVNGLPLAISGGGGNAWSFDVASLILRNSRFDLSDGAFSASVDVDRFELHDLKSWSADTPARFRLTGRINGAAMSIDGQATPFAASPEAGLTVDLDGFDLGGIAELAKRAHLPPPAGRIALRLTLAGNRDGIRLDGTVAATAFSSPLAEGQASAGRIQWHGQAALGRQPRITGTLTAEGLAAEMAGTGLALSRLDWTGGIRLDGDFAASGRLGLDDVRLQAAPLTAQARRIGIEGSFAPGSADGILPPLSGQGTASVDGLTVQEPGTDWLSAEHVEIAGLHLAAGQPARAARLDARAVGILAGRGGGDANFRRRFETRRMVAGTLRLDADGRLAVADATATDATLRATRTKTGWLGQPRAGGTGPAPRWALDRLRLDGRSKVDFDDRTLPETVRLSLDGVDLSLGELDTARPDHDSPFSLKARIGEGRVALNGTLRPFAERPGATVAGTLRNIDLPPLSPYAADSLGVHLHTGQLDADIRVASVDGKLDGKLDLSLAQLFVAQPDPNARLARQADMPVETVLDLLRDSDNRIHLTIPVRGDLDKPDFDVSDAVGQAVGGALKSTVVTTFKVAFPVAALIGLVIDEAEKPRLSLEPLSFAPGSAELSGTAAQRLDGIGELLTKRPGLKLSLCGMAATAADWPALLQKGSLLARLQKLVGQDQSVPPDPERLSGLAQSRAGAAKAYLAEQGGIDPGRLFTCRPQVGDDGKTTPGVRLLL